MQIIDAYGFDKKLLYIESEDIKNAILNRERRLAKEAIKDLASLIICYVAALIVYKLKLKNATAIQMLDKFCIKYAAFENKYKYYIKKYSK